MNVLHTIHDCIYFTFIHMYDKGRFVLHMAKAVLDPIPLWEHVLHTSNRKFLDTSRVSENLTQL